MDLAGARRSWEEWDRGIRHGEPRALEAVHRLLTWMAAHPQTNQLSDRELEVLQLMADGHTRREAAQKLWLSEETVKTHTKNIKAKLRARNGTHACVLAIRQGLIT